MAAFAIKAAVADPEAETFAFPRQKTMYGGKHIAVGDTMFVFASENEGGQGLIAMACVTAAEAIARKAGLSRQTQLISVEAGRSAIARSPLGRTDLRSFNVWKDGKPQTELNFKFYRQATNKIVGVSEATADFLRGYF